MADPLNSDVWMLFGLSGSGKSSFAHYLAESLGWRHIEIDQMNTRPNSILESRELVAAYSEFARTFDASGFVEALREQTKRSGHAGSIVSFRSNDFIPATAIKQNRRFGAETFYLVADARYCLRAFLARERGTGTNHSWQFWINNNAPLLAMLANDEMDEFTINTRSLPGEWKSHPEMHRDALDIIERSRRA
jgi:hypothetical protein